jgi:hypothetical protein
MKKKNYTEKDMCDALAAFIYLGEIFLNKKNKIKVHGCLVSIALDGFVRIVNC